VTKTGKQLVKETMVHMATPMTRDDIVAKFNRVCAFRSVPNEQRDRVRELWLGLRNATDIAQPMQALTTFGQPLPL